MLLALPQFLLLLLLLLLVVVVLVLRTGSCRHRLQVGRICYSQTSASSLHRAN
jgi:hypothetical protein